MKASIAGVLALAASSLCAQQADAIAERTLNVSGPVELDAVTDSGGISVTGGRAGSVQVRVFLKRNRGSGLFLSDIDSRLRELERNPPIEQSGNTIRLGYVTDKHLVRGISVRFEVTVPEETKLRARADSGGIHARGIRGPVECHTDSGGIDLDTIGAEVRASADSGGVRVRNVQGPVYARADSGGIEATGIAGAIDVETDSGGIHVAQTTPAAIRAQADSGGAHVKLAPSGGYDLNVASDSGRISVPPMTVRGAISRHRASGKVRGGGSLVDVKVDSGNIQVE